MSAKLPPAQAAILEAVIARFTEGATLEQIAQALTPVPSDRTLSRWLTALSEARRVERIGQARNTRYRALHPPSKEATRPATVVASSEPMAAPRESRRPAGMAPCPPTPGADITEQIFAAAIGDIVRFLMTRATAATVLQRMTELNIASVDDRRACFTLLEARLNAFTVAEAERYGLEPEQYCAWSENDALMTGAAGAGGAEAGCGMPSEGRTKEGDPALQQTAKPVPSNERDQARPISKEGDAIKVGRDGSARRVEAAAAANSGVSRFDKLKLPSLSREALRPQESSTPAGGPGVAAPNDAVSGFQQTATDMKRLMTPGRLAVSALWAGGVSMAATHLVGGGAAQAVTFLVAGVPPLLFIDRDRVAANKPMDLRAKLTTLVAGGSGSMLLAAPVSYVLESALGIFR